MNHVAKNKLLTWLVVLLLIANAVTIAMFWLGKAKQPFQQTRSPKDFLIKELKLDTKQQEQVEVLVKEHQQMAELLRERIRIEKEKFFDLLQQPDATDSAKTAASAAANYLVQKVDLMTLNHFQKIRALCNPEQQKRFDEIIHQVTAMMGQPRPPKGPGNDRQGPPPGGPDGDRPPPGQ